MASRISARFIASSFAGEARIRGEISKESYRDCASATCFVTKVLFGSFCPSDATIRCAAPIRHRRGPLRQFFYEAGLERHRWPRDSSRVASPPAGLALEAVIFPSSSFTPKEAGEPWLIGVHP